MLLQATPVVVDLMEVATVICIATQLETAVLILPRPASHVSAKCQEFISVQPQYGFYSCHLDSTVIGNQL